MENHKQILFPINKEESVSIVEWNGKREAAIVISDSTGSPLDVQMLNSGYDLYKYLHKYYGTGGVL
jgi:hypothetical protein